MNQSLPTTLYILNIYIAYMFALVLSFFLGFWIVMKYSRGYPFRVKVRYSVTAGLLASKFVIVIATLLGIDHVFLYIIIGKLWIPVSSNGLLFLSSLLTTISLNWDKIQKHLTITEEEYQQLFEV